MSNISRSLSLVGDKTSVMNNVRKLLSIINLLATAVQNLDSTIQPINHCPVDKN